MRKAFHCLFEAASGLALSCILLLLLGLLTWLGTLEQVDHGLFEVQRKYFESFLLWHDFGPVSIPLPGANLVMCILAVNLVLGGMVRIRKNAATAGILVTHAGILLLLVAGFTKAYFSQDGHITLFPGQSASQFQSYYRWEIAVLEDLGEGTVREHVIPHDRLEAAEREDMARFESPLLPFRLEISRWAPNADPTLKGPMFEASAPVVEGVFLRSLPKAKEAEQNLAGAYISAIANDDSRREGILWAGEGGPWTFFVGEKRFGATLRRERYEMPFAIQLEKFTKEDHPGISMAKSFSSDILVREGASQRPVHISMNAPLRDGGLVVYQASYGPRGAKPGDPLFSTLAVVRNPSDQWPLYACLVITAGMLLHFGRKLLLHMRGSRA